MQRAVYVWSMDGAGELELREVVMESDGSAGGAVVRLVASGEVDLSSSDRLIEAVERAVSQGANVVVLDATLVQFMDSSGLRAIVRCGQVLDAAGGRLLIEGMSGAVQRVLEVSGLIDRYRA